MQDNNKNSFLVITAMNNINHTAKTPEKDQEEVKNIVPETNAT
jgi:hypothetical protein